MNNVQAVLNLLEHVRSETLDRLAPLTQAQLDWRPPGGESEGEWSLGEVFMHLAMDEIYVRELITRPLCEGIKPPDSVQFLSPPPPYGTPKEKIEFWFQRARSGTICFFEDWPDDANLEIRHAGGLEPMNALEWMNGYASHERFHHRQIKDLLSRMP